MIYLNYIKNLSHKVKIASLLFFDFILIGFSIYLTEIIYLGYIPKISNALYLYFFLTFSFYFILSFLFKVYKQLNRFFGLHYIQNIFVVTTIIIIFLFLFKFIYDFRYLNSNFIILQNLLLLLLIIISRMIIQKLYFHNSNPNQSKINTIIFGAGSEGINLYRKLKDNSKYNILAFVDEDINKIGRLADGLKIYSLSRIFSLKKKENISKCFFCIPSASSLKLKELEQTFKSNNIDIEELKKNSSSNYSLPMEINCDNKIADLSHVSNFIENKTVLVTGAAGTIGQEICIQLKNLNIKKIYCLDSNEYSLAKLKKKIEFLNLQSFEYILLDLTNKDLLDNFLQTKKIDIVFHAAAHKHVDIVEENISYSCRNNLKSVINILEACNESKIKNFVFISTDKAVRPSNIMGLTKRCGELLTYHFSQKDRNNNYCSVRFGNVIGSSGSLLEILKKQVYDGGPITLTDKRASRYFMTISDAVSLVLEGTSLKKNGKILVLNMGNPINIYELIKSFLKTNNLSEKNLNNKDDKDTIEIKIIGLRKGEKLHEELFYDNSLKKSKEMISFENINDKYAQLDLDKFNKELNQHISANSISEIKRFLNNFADL